MNVSFASLVVVLVFAAAYVFGCRLIAPERMERLWARRRMISAAAGISVAYVFVDVLPELELQHKVLVERAVAPMLFVEQRLYVLAMLSFVVFYGLEHMVLVSRERRPEALTAGAVDPVFGLQLAGYAAYSALIGYLVVERAERGAVPLVLYTIAMAVHFLIVDHSLGEEHGRAYGRGARWILAASVVVGWLIALATPLSETVVARLFAVLVGGVVITSLRSELPDDRKGRFWPFCLSAVVFATVLSLA
jgi:hypothetical protein